MLRSGKYGATWYRSRGRNTSARESVFPSQTAHSWEPSTVVDVMNRFSDTLQTVTDRILFGSEAPYGINMLTNSGCIAQALSSLNHSSTVRQTIVKCNVPVSTTRLVQLERRTRRNIPVLIFLRWTRTRNPTEVGS